MLVACDNGVVYLLSLAHVLNNNLVPLGLNMAAPLTIVIH